MPATMASGVEVPRNQTPRWWRRFIVTSRRKNIFAYIEIAAAIAIVVIGASTWATFTNAPPDGALLPSRQVAGLLIGMLIPSMALLVLAGRSLWYPHEEIYATYQCIQGFGFSFCLCS